MKRTYFVCLFLCLATTFVLSQPNPIPFVNQPLVPTSVPPGSPGFTLTVNGAGFASTSVVNWNGAPLSTTFVSVDKLQAVVPSSDLASPSTASVTVSSPGGQTSNVVPFTITSPTTSVAFATSTIPTGLNPGGVVVADFNHDGKLDLAIVNQNDPDPACYAPDRGNSGTISILLGNGDGTFSNGSTLCFDNYISVGGDVARPQLLAADFNGDGKMDLMASFTFDGELRLEVFLGNGDGTFTRSGGCCGSDLIRGVAAADFNRDGKLDVAVPSLVGLASFDIYTFLGNGNGTFAFYSGVGESWGLSFGSNLATGDFNNDGILDLALPTEGSPSVTILLGNGDGSFTLAPSQPSATLVESASVVAGDFDGDGILDLAIADAGSTALTILKGNGDGTFTQVSGEPTLSDFSNLVTTADLNGDGKLDLVFFSSVANTISIFLGNGDGTFHAGLIEAMDYAPYGVAVGDFNGDGRLDLAVTNSTDNTVSILLQTAPRPGATITLASEQNPVAINQPVNYTAVVWASPTMPTGSITFKQGATVLGAVPLTDGQASFTTTFAAAGTFPIVASYSGDQNYGARNSQAVKQVVDKYATDASIYFSPNPSVYGQAVALTCQVTNGTASPPTGTVTFKNGPFLLGTAPLVNGTAILTKRNLPAGTTLITATYNGDASNNKASSQWNQFVNQATTTTTVSSSPNPSTVGQKVKLTATVTSPTVAAVVGTVTFTAGTTTLGQVRLAGGKAILTTSSLATGTTTVTATYNGTANIAGSSGSVKQTVN